MSNSPTTKPKVADAKATTTTTPSLTTAERPVATTGSKGRSRASTQAVFSES